MINRCMVYSYFVQPQAYAKNHEYLPEQLHDLLNTVEMLHETKTYLGSATKLFAIVEKFAALRPVSTCN